MTVTTLPADYPNRPTRLEAERDAANSAPFRSRFLGGGTYACCDPWCPRRGESHAHGLLRDSGTAAVALVLAGCLVGALLALAFLAVLQPAVCAMHDSGGPRYCHPTTTSTQETSR